MSTNKKMILATAAALLILAIVGVAYNVGRVAPPADEEVAGAIGAATRYRTEQISDTDVQLVEITIEEAVEYLSDEELAELMENAPDETLGAFFARADEELNGRLFRSLSLARQLEVARVTGAETQARIALRADPETARVWWGRLTEAQRNEHLARLSLRSEEFGRLAARDQLARLDDAALAAAFSQARENELARAWAAMKDDELGRVVSAARLSERAAALRGAGLDLRVAYARQGEIASRAALLRTAEAGRQQQLMSRALAARNELAGREMSARSELGARDAAAARETAAARESAAARETAAAREQN